MTLSNAVITRQPDEDCRLEPLALEAVERRLLAATSLPEVKAVRDDMEVLGVLARRAHRGLANQNRIAHKKVLAERRAGELLSQLPKSAGGRPPEKTPGGPAGVSPYRAALQENQISERSAERWQFVARWVDEDAIKGLYERCVAEGEEFASKTVFDEAEWRSIEAAQGKPRAKRRAAHAQGQAWWKRKHLGDSLPKKWWQRPRQGGRPTNTLLNTLCVPFDNPAQHRAVTERLDAIGGSSGMGRAGALAQLVEIDERTGVLRLKYGSAAERDAAATRLDAIARDAGTDRPGALALLLDLWASTHQAPPAGAREAT
jgi:hypothetical protein